jgi:hypothetical protein
MKECAHKHDGVKVIRNAILISDTSHSCVNKPPAGMPGSNIPYLDCDLLFVV